MSRAFISAPVFVDALDALLLNTNQAELELAEGFLKQHVDVSAKAAVQPLGVVSQDVAEACGCFASAVALAKCPTLKQ